MSLIALERGLLGWRNWYEALVMLWQSIPLRGDGGRSSPLVAMEASQVLSVVMEASQVLSVVMEASQVLSW
jgi:hypothetical protein